MGIESDLIYNSKHRISILMEDINILKKQKFVMKIILNSVPVSALNSMNNLLTVIYKFQHLNFHLFAFKWRWVYQNTSIKDVFLREKP